MKIQSAVLSFYLLLVACASPIAPQINNLTLSPTNIATMSAKTPTPSSTSQIDSLLIDKCEKAWENAVGPGVSNQLQETYSDMGCKSPEFSPDKQYLAYVTLSLPKNQPTYVDSVKIIKPSTGMDKTIHFAGEKDFIGKIEWSPTGKLIIWELIWEGPWVIFIYDPITESMINALRLNEDNKLEWNPQRSAFYASHLGEYGRNSCVIELNGYDFQFENQFPDFFEIYNIEKENNDPFGIPYGKYNTLSIEPFAWSTDGDSLFITITPLTLLDNKYYKIEPKQAGVVNFSDTGAKFTILDKSQKLDYFFEKKESLKIVSEPYNPKYCPSQ